MAGAGSSSVSLTYTADVAPMIAQIKKGLASVSGMTEAEARKWAKDIDKNLKKIATSQNGLGESSKGAGKAVQGIGRQLHIVGTQMPDVVTQLSSGTSAMQVLTQQGLQVVQQLAVTGGAMSALLGPIGLLAAGLAALGVAYAAITGPIEREIEAQKELAQINRSTEATHRALEAAYIKQAVALGALTEAQGREMSARDASRQAVLDFAAAQKEQRAEIEGTIKSSERLLEVTRGLFAILPDAADKYSDQVNVLRRAADAAFGWSDSIESARSQLAALDTALLTEAEQQSELRDVTIATADALDQGAKAADGYAEALKRTAEATQRDLEREAEYRERLKEVAAARLELASIVEGSTKSEAPRLDAIIQQREQELYRIEELVAATGALEQGEAARAQVVKEAAIDEAELRAELIEKLEKQQERAHEREMQRIQQQRAGYLQAGDTIAGSMATVADALENAQGASEEQRMNAFRVAKGIAMAQAVINTAQAVTSALTLPPPAGEIAAVAVGAAGAAQIATIAATEPSFHQGGLDWGLAPDEVRTVRRTTVEGTLTGRGVRAAGGREGVQELNRGQAPVSAAGPTVVAVLTPPGAPSRLLREGLRTRAGAAMVQSAARPSVLRVRR